MARHDVMSIKLFLLHRVVVVSRIGLNKFLYLFGGLHVGRCLPQGCLPLTRGGERIKGFRILESRTRGN
jgi:hypothetical protein